MAENKHSQDLKIGKKKIWVGEISGIFGAGLTAVGHTKEEVMDSLKKGYVHFKKMYPDNRTKFETSFEYYGGYVTEVEFGKWYLSSFSK